MAVAFWSRLNLPKVWKIVQHDQAKDIAQKGPNQKGIPQESKVADRLQKLT